MLRQMMLGCVVALTFSWQGSLALAQGLLVFVHPHPVPLPRPIIVVPPSPPPLTYKIKEVAVQTRITDQVAKVQVSQSFVNTGSRQMEVQFVFPLPYESAIDSLTLLVDGKEFAGKLMPADEARRIYEGYIRRNQDPALLEWLGTGMFQTSVFPVPPGAERKVTLSYNQLLKKDGTLTDFLYPLSTAKYSSQPVEKLTIQVAIESSQEIKNVYSPTHAVNIQRPDSKHAVVKLEATNTIPVADFRLFYDVAPGALGASVLSFRPEKGDDGYLLLLASPEVKAERDERVPKTVIFVVDRSGSMSGKKMDQAKEALKFVLNNLRQGDLFNIVAYDNAIESFRPELQGYNEETRQAAVGFAEGLFAGGSTNIDGALKTALDQIKDTSRPNYVLFLTDGLPTAGETAEQKIVLNSKQRNAVKARVIVMGVGYDVNSRLLDRLARENFGQSGYVRPDENIETHVSSLYKKISSPVMTDVAVKFEFDAVKTEEGPPVHRLYPKQVYDLFAGEQLVLVGRYKKNGAAKVSISGKVGGAERKFEFPANLVEASGDESYAFVAKLWAMRRIGEIIDEIDLAGKNDELVKELVALSTKYGILTPYTSYLADDQARPGELARMDENLRRASRGLEQLGIAEGKAGVAQRAEKSALQNAAQPAADAGFAGPAGSAPAAPMSKFRDIETDREVAAESVITIDNQALYKRGKQWIAANAADVDIEKDDAQIKAVDRFSEDYFNLVRGNSTSENAVFARQQTGEDLIIRLRGQVYRIKG